MTDNSKKFRIWESAALLAICLSLCIGTWAQSRQQSISGKLIRLHVIAVSDEEAEQEIKLRVRDAVLEYLSPVLEDASGQADAKSIIYAHLEGIAKAAETASQGRKVTVSLGRETYPTRDYEGFSLPAGEYESLRVVLGQGQGKNWWCVVFPPVCLTAADAQLMQSVMSTPDYSIVSGSEDYELRFRLLELWGEFTNALDRK